MTDVIVKFRRITEAKAQEQRLKQIVGPDAIETQALFPGDELEDLATICQVRLPDSASVERVLSALREEPDVEYAHVPAGRLPA